MPGAPPRGACWRRSARGPGLTGVPDMFEGERGFGVALSRDVDWAKAVETLGDEWTITRMTVKPHPCCGHTFAAIDAAQALMAEGIDPEAIERVEVGTYRAAVEICENADPKTPYEAKFSLPYTVALAALGRAVDLAAFAPEALHDPALRAMMAQVQVALDPAAEAAFPGLRAAEVAIATRDGQTRRYRQPTRRGDPDFPLGDARSLRQVRHAGHPGDRRRGGRPRLPRRCGGPRRWSGSA